MTHVPLHHKTHLRCSKCNSSLGARVALCSRCRDAVYCTNECRVLHWMSHFKNCELEKQILPSRFGHDPAHDEGALTGQPSSNSPVPALERETPSSTPPTTQSRTLNFQPCPSGSAPNGESVPSSEASSTTQPVSRAVVSPVCTTTNASSSSLAVSPPLPNHVLVVVCDLDHSLLHCSSQRPTREELQTAFNLHKVLVEGRELWVAYRRGLAKFLTLLIDMADQVLPVVYTNGSEEYATQTVQHFDPDGRIFRGRVISRKTNADGTITKKNIHEIQAVLQKSGVVLDKESIKSRLVVLDDRINCWTRDLVDNVLQLSPFMHFRDGVAPHPLFPGLQNVYRDEYLVKPDTQLSDATKILFALRAARLQECDVAPVLRKMRQKVFGGCSMYVSHTIFEQHNGTSENGKRRWFDELNRGIARFGGTVLRSVTKDATHAIGTHKAVTDDPTMQSLTRAKHNVIVVNVTWLYQCMSKLECVDAAPFPLEGGIITNCGGDNRVQQDNRSPLLNDEVPAVNVAMKPSAAGALKPSTAAPIPDMCVKTPRQSRPVQHQSTAKEDVIRAGIPARSTHSVARKQDVFTQRPSETSIGAEDSSVLPNNFNPATPKKKSAIAGHLRQRKLPPGQPNVAKSSINTGKSSINTGKSSINTGKSSISTNKASINATNSANPSPASTISNKMNWPSVPKKPLPTSAAIREKDLASANILVPVGRLGNADAEKLRSKKIKTTQQLSDQQRRYIDNLATKRKQTERSFFRTQRLPRKNKTQQRKPRENLSSSARALEHVPIATASVVPRAPPFRTNSSSAETMAPKADKQRAAAMLPSSVQTVGGATFRSARQNLDQVRGNQCTNGTGALGLTTNNRALPRKTIHELRRVAKRKMSKGPLFSSLKRTKGGEHSAMSSRMPVVVDLVGDDTNAAAPESQPASHSPRNVPAQRTTQASTTAPNHTAAVPREAIRKDATSAFAQLMASAARPSSDSALKTAKQISKSRQSDDPELHHILQKSATKKRSTPKSSSLASLRKPCSSLREFGDQVPKGPVTQPVSVGTARVKKAAKNGDRVNNRVAGVDKGPSQTPANLTTSSAEVKRTSSAEVKRTSSAEVTQTSSAEVKRTSSAEVTQTSSAQAKRESKKSKVSRKTPKNRTSRWRPEPPEELYNDYGVLQFNARKRKSMIVYVSASDSSDDDCNVEDVFSNLL